MDHRRLLGLDHWRSGCLVASQQFLSLRCSCFDLSITWAGRQFRILCEKRIGHVQIDAVVRRLQRKDLSVAPVSSSKGMRHCLMLEARRCAATCRWRSIEDRFAENMSDPRPRRHVPIRMGCDSRNRRIYQNAPWSPTSGLIGVPRGGRHVNDQRTKGE